MSELEAKLRRLAASLDAAALEALANKGLLRRAQKDLERGISARVVGESATVLRLEIGEFVVSLPESGPALATCTCPAAGICQHLLSAVLFLQKADTDKKSEAAAADISPLTSDYGKPTPPSSDGFAELMRITPEQLESWAGKSAFKAGLKLASQFTPDIVRERTLRISFSLINMEVHIVPAGGLDGAIVSGGRGDGRQLVVAAVVCFQRNEGTAWSIPTDITALEASEGTPRTRTEVLESCQTLLSETLNNGLSHISPANQQRWATLAVSALGVNLPRLALALRGVGDEAALVAARDARSDVSRMLSRMAQTHALTTALQNGGDHPRVDLVGSHRTRYDEVGHLDLFGAAAWPWRTASGYEGLTVLFWDSTAKGWNSWTESRPRHQLGDFKPLGRFTQPGPWEGAASPQQLARSSFRLMNARRNPAHRISASTKSRVLITGKTNLPATGIDRILDWSQLLDLANRQTVMGLKEANPLDSIVALQPTTWGERGFDAVTQVFNWVVVDNQQRPLLLELGFEEFTESAINFLEKVPPDSLAGALVIGRIQSTPRGLSLNPYSIHRSDGEIIHLCLDHAKPITTAATAALAEDETGFEDYGEEPQTITALSLALGRLLGEIDDNLFALAESGLSASNPLHVERLRQVSPRAVQLGLTGLTQSLTRVIQQPKPHTLLRCVYIAHLHRRAMSVSTPFGADSVT